MRKTMTYRERCLRGAVAWKIFEVGDLTTRLAHKVLDEVPTVEIASEEWFAAGQRLGEPAYRRGLADGVTAALAEWQSAANDPTPAERASGLRCGPPVARVIILARELGLDGAQMVQRVVDAVGTPEAAR